MAEAVYQLCVAVLLMVVVCGVWSRLTVSVSLSYNHEVALDPEIEYDAVS